MKLLKQTWYPAVPVLNLYPGFKRMRGWAIAGIVCLTATISVVAYFGSGYFPDILSEYLFVASFLIVGVSAFLYPLLFRFAGMEDFLTVFDNKTILRQGKVKRFLLVPDLVHRVALEDSCKAECEILDLEKKCDDFDQIIQGLDFSLPGKKSLLFYFKVEWVIHEDKPLVWEEESNIPKVYKKALEGILANKLPQVLCEHIEGIIGGVVCRLQEEHLEVPPAVKFSKFVFDQVMETLAREERFSSFPFIAISVKNFQVALRTEIVVPI